MDTFHKTTKYFWLGLITPSFASIKLWASFRQVPIMTGHPVKYVVGCKKEIIMVWYGYGVKGKNGQ